MTACSASMMKLSPSLIHSRGPKHKRRTQTNSSRASAFGLRVRRPDGSEIDFIPSSAAASFDVGEARELKVASGDWLLLQANHGKEFINGERVQVQCLA